MRLTRPILPLLALATLARVAAPADRTDARSAATRQTSPQPIGPTLEVYSRETFVDIVVTDAKGHPVHGLTQADFTILEDGQEMTPKSFEEHRSDLPTPAPTAQPKLDLGPNTFTKFTPIPPRAGPLNILLLDSLNTATQIQQIVIQRMLDYIDKMPQGTQFAVLRLTTSLTIVQGFTSDRDLLRAAITNGKNLWAEPPFEDPLSERGLQPPILEDPAAAVEKEGNQSGARGQYEMAAMRQLARYLSGMPGRKNLIWFSGSFPLQFPPLSDSCIFGDRPLSQLRYMPCTSGPGPVQKYDFEAEMKSATDLLARSHVSVYPIDGRGVDTIRGPRSPISGQSNNSAMQLGEQATMDLIADRTGGHAFYNTNGLTEAVQQAIDNGSNFYTVTYTPTNEKLDTRFRKITVKVNQPGLHLTYREGYYAVDPAIDSRGHKVVPNATPMQTALLRGAPEPTELIFKVRVLSTPATDAALPANNQPDPKQMKPPFRRYTVWYAAGIRNVQFAIAPDGTRRGAVELTILVYNADGNIVNSTATVLRPSLTPAQYASMLQSGAVTSQEIAVPAKGDFFLRIAVHDLASDRVGAVEVPLSSIHPEPVPAVASSPIP